MSKGSIELYQKKNGEWDIYDDTWDITIHCETEAEQKVCIEALEKFNEKSVPLEEIEKAYESIMDVAEGGYVDIEEVKVHFCKWLGKEDV